MFSKKKRRKITVKNVDYYWIASGNDGWIDLYIMAKDANGPQMMCQFDYHHDMEPLGRGGSTPNQFVITPYTVRQVIEYGLANGWDPMHKGKEIFFGQLDDKIDLRLTENKESVIKNK